MAHLVEDITKHFQFEDVDIDCWTFKLYSKGCVILFFAGSMVGVMSQYFGEPIQCDFKVKMQLPQEERLVIRRLSYIYGNVLGGLID